MLYSGLVAWLPRLCAGLDSGVLSQLLVPLPAPVLPARAGICEKLVNFPLSKRRITVVISFAMTRGCR